MRMPLIFGKLHTSASLGSFAPIKDGVVESVWG
jgi:hypothetical protein